MILHAEDFFEAFCVSSKLSILFVDGMSNENGNKQSTSKV